MPPRYAYWTILIGNEPTAFRASAMEDIMPTFNRLKDKQPTAVLKWFQNGKLWTSRIEAREAMAHRGDKGRRSDPRHQPGASVGGWRGKPAIADGGGKPEKAPAFAKTTAEKKHEPRPEWKPKGKGPGGGAKPEWKPRGEGGKPAWQPKSGGFSRSAKPEWKPKSATRPEWKPRGDDAKPAWKPKSSTGSAAPSSASRPKPQGLSREHRSKPEWKPKSTARPADAPTGRPDPRDKKWRPGGDHKDPRQKYKDAKKAKWTRFKQAIRARSGHKKKREDE